MQELNQFWRHIIQLKSKFIFFLFGFYVLGLLALPFTSKAQDSLSTLPPKQISVSAIYIVGNEKTEREIILRELDFISNYTYDWETFLGILKRR